jgi:hypothetical protein
MTTSSTPVRGPDAARGPLVVATANPRYFTAGAGDTADQEAVYLTGSHIWNNLQDGMGPGPGCAETSERLDYDAYLDLLAEHGTTSSGSGAGSRSSPRPPAATSTCA